MFWRHGKAYAQDLRDRVLAAAGRLREVAERSGVSQAYVSRVRSRHGRLNQACAGAQRNHVPLRLAGAARPEASAARAMRRAGSAGARKPAASRAEA